MNNLMAGTLIEDLQKEDYDTHLKNQQLMQNTRYNAMQNSHAEHSHNGAQFVQQGQHDPYYNIDNNYGYPQEAQQFQSRTNDVRCLNNTCSYSTDEDLNNMAKNVTKQIDNFAG